MPGLLSFALAGAAQGAGQGIVERANQRREEALARLQREQELADRQQGREWALDDDARQRGYQEEDRDLGYARDVATEGRRRGYDVEDRDLAYGREDAERGRDEARIDRTAQALGSALGGSSAPVQSVAAAGAGWTEVVLPDGTTERREGTRAWRNHNPGNIEFGDFAREHGAVGTDGRFAVFPTYEAGRNAKAALLFDSGSYRDLSISAAINRYAPPSENNSTAYAAQVAAAAGVPVSTPMSALNADQREAVLDAMERVEGFREGTINGAAARPAPSADALAALADPETAGPAVEIITRGLAPPATTTFRAATSEEAAARGAVAGQIDDATGRFYPAPTAASGTTVNVGAGEGSFAKRTGELMADEAAAIVDQGAAAARSLGQIETLGQILERTPQGAAGGFIAAAGRFGIAMDGLDDVQAAQALMNQMTPMQRPPGSGTMSDADLALYQAAIPQILNTPGGNQRILSTMRAVAEYDVARANIARQLQLGQIDPTAAANAYAALPNPIPQEFRGGVGATPTAAATSAPSVFLTHPNALATAEAAGMTVEELWGAMDDEGRAAWAN